ncbi:MAG: tyrosine-type recombinase/integrase [Mycoplasma sp.]
MTYNQYLENKNLSKNTIAIYMKMLNHWENITDNEPITKTLFVKLLKEYSSNHSANSTRLFYHAIISYLKFNKKTNLVNNLRDVKLPTSAKLKRKVISYDEFLMLKDNVDISSFMKKRNWIIFVILFTTGIRANEISQIKPSKVIDGRIKINGKGSKERIVYLCDYLLELISDWKYDQINIKRSGDEITYKQLNILIGNFTKNKLGYRMKPHDLRSSYATHLLKQNINIKIVSELLGHSNINTTSRYLHFTGDEISSHINRSFV